MNSNAWYNIYSQELKYNIVITKSKSRVQLTCAFALLCVAILTISSYLIWFLSWIWSVCFSFIAYYLIVKRLISFCNTDLNHGQIISLHQNGEVDYLQGSHFVISSSSRIGWFGCWLTLKPKGNVDLAYKGTRAIIQQFIFRDSVTEHAYARLCRQILKARNVKGIKNRD